MVRVEWNANSTIEQLVMAEAMLQILGERIEANGHEVPASLAHDLSSVTSVLNQRLRADRMRELAALKLRRDQLLPQNVKLRNVNEEIARLEKEVKA
jgi:hypothetical protein